MFKPLTDRLAPLRGRRDEIPDAVSHGTRLDRNPFPPTSDANFSPRT
jgi:hypothetical protein